MTPREDRFDHEHRNDVATMLLDRRGDQRLGLRTRDQDWTWDEVLGESAARATLACALRDENFSTAPFHVGVLLDNVPDFVFWLGAAALAGATVVGLNPTRGTDGLAADIRHADCQLIVTDARGMSRLKDLDHGLDSSRFQLIDDPGYRRRIEACWAEPAAMPGVDSRTLFLLLFTSGTTGISKAVRCSQGRLARIAHTATEKFGHHRDDVDYCCMPLFHGNALMALWAPALANGAAVCLTPKFTAAGFLPDVRYFGATFFTYVGKALGYLMATPEQPDDADNTLVRGFGTEASPADQAEFRRRFDAELYEGYGSSEGGAVAVGDPAAPAGALGRPAHPDVAIVDPASLKRCPAAVLDARGRVLNPDEAIGEIVDQRGARDFEGYYRNDAADAERVRNGWYWSGDLGYVDTAGFLYFAGRRGDWIRVDGENTSALNIEHVVRRHPEVITAAVYAVPDPRSGDQVMAAIEVADPETFDVEKFVAFLVVQDDLGAKGIPRLIRVSADLPATGSNKVLKRDLQSQRWHTQEPVYRWAGRGRPEYRRLTDGDRHAMDAEFAEHGRKHLSNRDTGPNRDTVSNRDTGSDWDETTDVLVVGSGAGGVTGAYTAAREGLEVILVEATEKFGGTTAYSGGGGMWFPCNPVLLRAGTDDSIDDALEYYTAVVGDRTPRELQETYVRSGAPLVEYLESDEQIKFTLLPWPDYFGKAPKARADGMRHIAAKPLKVAVAPDLRDLIRGPLDTDRLGQAAPEGYFVGGRALIARFLSATRKLEHTSARLNTALTELIVEDGAVVGAVVETDGHRSRIRARRGVLLAAGGFERNDEMRARYGVPGRSRDTMGPWGNRGLAHLAAMAAGADVDLMDQAWWSPGLTHPDGTSAFALWFTGGIFVDDDGRRFVNESAAYDRLGRDVLAAMADGRVTLPYWMIYDDINSGADGTGGIPPVKATNVSMVEPQKYVAAGLWRSADTLEELAEEIGVPPQNLVETVTRFNDFVRRGVDDDFGRGDEPYDRAFSGGATPLHAIEHGPFHAAAFGVSDLGTKGGLRTDTAARVLDTADNVIPGLYAAGNTMAAPSGTAYPGGGIPIGTSMVFSHLAVLDMTTRGGLQSRLPRPMISRQAKG